MATKKIFSIKNGADVTGNTTSANLDILKELPTISPSLNLDFAKTKALDPRITFTRASSATYIGSDGLIKLASNNEPRFDHDPVTGECKGLLIEESRTNLLQYSEDATNAYWAKSQLSTTNVNIITSPDGNQTADGIVANTSNFAHYYEYNVTGLTAATNYCSSIYIKKGKSLIGNLSVYGTGNAVHSVSINFDTGVVSTGVSAEFTSGGGVTTGYGAVNVGNGWWRIWISGYPDTAATNRRFRIFLYNETGVWGSFIGDGVSSYVYVWGAQLEAGSFPTSYIPTTTTSLTRSADLASMTGTNFSSWYNQNEGTILVQSRKLVIEPESRYPFIYDISDGTGNNRISTLWFTSSNLIYTTAQVFSSYVTSIGYYNETQTSLNNLCTSYKLNDYSISLNSKTPITDTVATVPIVNKINIGAGVTNTNHLNGHISKLVYYPKRLSNSILQSLTQ